MDKNPKMELEGLVPLADGGAGRFGMLAKQLPQLLDASRSAPAIQRGSGIALPETPGVYLLVLQRRL